MHQPNMFLNSFLGYTMWDYESDAPRMWPEKQQYPDRREDPRRCSTAIPKARRRAASGRDVELPEAGVRAQSADEGHAVRRLSRPRLEVPRRVQARSQGQPARRGRQASSATTIRRSSRRPCTCRRSTSTSACNASTATSRRTTTATATSTAKSRPRSRSTARTATAPRRACRTLYTSGPAALGGGTDMTTLRTPDGRRRFEWVGDALYQRSMMDPNARMEDEPGQGRGRSRPAPTTTRRRRAPS